MKTFLVTGGAGFIGSHLVDALLAQGHAVRVVDDLSTGKRTNLDPRAELIQGDVADTALIAEAARGSSAIFHLAAIASVERSNREWLATHRANQTGTIAVLDAARLSGRVPVVYASSAAVYGDLGEGAIAEWARPAPRTAYGADKLGSELHAAVAAEVHGVPTVGLRFFNVYGPRQDPSSPYSGVISIFAARISAGLGIVLHGDGQQTRDFVHVADVVAHLRAAQAMMKGAERPSATVLNVCTGRATAIAELARILGDVLGQQVQMSFAPPRAGDIRSSLGDPAAAKAALGMTAGIELSDGLRAAFGA